jgi:hypothetical protein
MQGISSIQPLFTKISLENACESSGFATDSVRGAKALAKGDLGLNFLARGILESAFL